jgi:hypothetical protein
MYDAINCSHLFFLLLSVVIYSIPTTVINTLIIAEATSSMPVKTRSMAKSGLQRINNTVPPLSTCPTCYNAITITSDSTVVHESPGSSIVMPKLSKQSPLSLSSSGYDSSSDSSLESTNFETLKFRNLNLPSDDAVSSSHNLSSSYFFQMESHCQESKVPPAPNISSSP